MRPRYHHQVVGINSRLDSFQAAVLRVKLQFLGEAIESRQNIAKRYSQMFAEEGLADGERCVVPHAEKAAYHVWNQYAVRVPAGRRDGLRSYLAERGIGTEIYYPIPVHRQQCYAGADWAAVELPETDRACQEVLNLPIFPELTEAEQQQVVLGIRSYFAEHGRRAA